MFLNHLNCKLLLDNMRINNNNFVLSKLLFLFTFSTFFNFIVDPYIQLFENQTINHNGVD